MVKACAFIHVAALDVVRQVVDDIEPTTLGATIDAVEELKTDVIDGFTFFISIL